MQLCLVDTWTDPKLLFAVSKLAVGLHRSGAGPSSTKSRNGAHKPMPPHTFHLNNAKTDNVDSRLKKMMQRAPPNAKAPRKRQDTRKGTANGCLPE